MTDWQRWHADYDDPSSRLSERLRAVQERLHEALTEAPAPGGVIRLLSLCAGEGRDVLPVVAAHPRGGAVVAVLVELDPVLAANARAAAGELGIAERVDVRCADAGRTDAYVDAVPAEVVLACGIFGNVSDQDIHRTVEATAAMTTHGGFVLWTRHRYEPDLTPTIRQWFADTGFTEVAFDAPGGASWSVGMQRRAVEPQRLFEFTTRPPR